MPPHPPDDRSQLSAAVHSAVAQSAAQRTIPEPRASPYTSLDQALVQSAQSRDNSDLLCQQRSSDPSSTMASDSRYIYYAPQEVQGPHGYPQYPPYDAPQYAPNPARPMRNGVPQPAHQPPQQPPSYPAPPNGYAHPAAYVTPAYGGPPPHPPHPPAHWSPEAWQHFSAQSFVPSNPPLQEPQQYANNARAEVQPQPASEPRAPSDNTPKPANSQPSDGHSTPPVGLTPQLKARTVREAPQTQPIAPPPSTLPLPLPLDFVKLMDSYRLIMDSAHAMAADTGQGRHVGQAEEFERMLQAAAYGAQALEAAVKRTTEVPPVPPSTEQQIPPEEGDGSGGKSRQQKPDTQGEGGGQHCLGCSATSTPEWRRGPMGPRTLCNACGLVYAKLIKKRTREPGRARNGTQSRQGGHSHLPDGLSSGEDGSDQGSQGRRSEVPDERQG